MDRLARWRRWIPGRRYGPARGTAVYGSGRLTPEVLQDLLSRTERLDAWRQSRGIELTATPADLSLLDQALDDQALDDRALGDQALGEHPGDEAATLSGDIGRFLGTVIVLHVPGARWRLWPNGYPVVRLAGRRDLDVIALASDRASNGTPRLADIYARAASLDEWDQPY